MKIDTKVLKVFYNALLTGMPSLTYNPYNKNPLHAPFQVEKYSTYINYRLDETQYNKIENYLYKKSNNLKLVPTSILKSDEKSDKEYLLSINIYNCTSPIFNFLSNKSTTRCEINTYVVDKYENEGTLIMDYTSNLVSIDPDNIFRFPKEVIFTYDNERNLLSGNSRSDDFRLDFKYYLNTSIDNYYTSDKLSSDLLKKTDKIFYNNGLFDKVYYDSTLTENDLKILNNYTVEFTFLDLKFTDIDSVFYFSEPINLVGGMWANLF